MKVLDTGCMGIDYNSGRRVMNVMRYYTDTRCSLILFGKNQVLRPCRTRTLNPCWILKTKLLNEKLIVPPCDILYNTIDYTYYTHCGAYKDTNDWRRILLDFSYILIYTNLWPDRWFNGWNGPYGRYKIVHITACSNVSDVQYPNYARIMSRSVYTFYYTGFISETFRKCFSSIPRIWTCLWNMSVVPTWYHIEMYPQHRFIRPKCALFRIWMVDRLKI